MGRTFIRQETQIRNSDAYDDTVAPSLANYETNPADIEDDLNNVRSMLSYLKDVQAGNWYDVLVTPSALDTGTQRGVDNLNTDLHAVERKRILTAASSLADIGALGSVQHVVLGSGELPPNTTAAVGAVTTAGTVVAYEASFDTATLTEVTGATAVSPKNLVEIVDASTRDPILDSSGRRVWGLAQSESSTDGHTISATTPNRVQLSFVVINSAGDDLQLVAAADMNGLTINVNGWVQRKALEDLTEQDFLRGAACDVPASATVTRQVAYNNQGTTPVDVTTNSTLDLEGAGLTWTIRDDLEAVLFQIVEGSSGATSQVNIGPDVDEFDVDAAVVDFLQGITVDSGGTSLDIGAASPGVITSGGLLTLASTSADLTLNADGDLIFVDDNYAGGSYDTPFNLSDASSEWDTFETNFGEVSLLNAINQAYEHGARNTKVYAVVTSTTVADTDVGGVGGGTNLDAQLPDMSGGTFTTDYDVFLNGCLLRPGADAAANHDYYPGTSLPNGQLKFEFTVKTNDVIAVIPYA